MGRLQRISLHKRDNGAFVFPPGLFPRAINDNARASRGFLKTYTEERTARFSFSLSLSLSLLAFLSRAPTRADPVTGEAIHSILFLHFYPT